MTDDKKTQPKETAPKKTTPKEKPAVAAKDKTAESTAEAPTEARADKNYSRGEGQKTVTQAYKDNWNAIYRKKKKKR